ncbi:MAG: histidine kinase [Actinomycetota bacterium]
MATPIVPPLSPRGLVGVAIATWTLSVVAAAAFPWAFPVLVLVIVFPLVLAIPHLDRAALVPLLVGGLVALAVGGALALGNDDGGVFEDIEDEIELVVVIVGLVGFGLLITSTIRHTNAAHRDVADAAVALGAQVAESRRRLVQTADEERARLERDLHDGAQQHLVALGIDLRRIKSKASRGAGDLESDLAGAVDALDEAIAEVRALAHGIYPPLLEVRGLPDALAAAARRSANEVSVRTDQVGRLERDVEAALYFCTVEALANSDKHAAGTSVEVSLSRTDEGVVLRIADHGGLDADHVPGRGVTNMRDRIEALEGTFGFVADEAGTSIVASIPIEESA